ncbi:unnamed protein product [Ophioblennius macclurei]
MRSWFVMHGTLLVLLVLLVLAGAHQCPDGGRCLEGGGTCCSRATGDGFDCCPLDQAECCGDHLHCCPAHTVCQPSTSSCVNATASVPWVDRVSADRSGLSRSFRMIRTPERENADDVVCPDRSRCPAEFSCLKTPPDGFGCCPLPQGVPCPDGRHCCPDTHRCSADGHSCIREDGEAPAAGADKVKPEKVPERSTKGVPPSEGEVKVSPDAAGGNDVPCDDTTACPDGSTCCKDKEGQWGCCPLPEAVCCSDGVHCCPNGQTCNLAEQTCDSGLNSAPWLSKVAAIRRTVVPCDDTTACPDGSTCCKDKEGQWGCCPLPKAVCCSDGVHCCPNGQTCNLAEQTCDSGLNSAPWLSKVAAIRRTVVPCDDTTACPDGSTCCKDKEGQWGCCPLPKAVCCSDGVHCCPNGQTCNLAEQTCDSGLNSAPWLSKVAAIRRTVVPCDDTTACPDGSTCCKDKEGQWGCCPLPKAVCCSDGVHCCPNGQTCNLPAQTCDSGLNSAPWLEKVAAIRRTVVQCDDHLTTCPDGSTCCRMKSGRFGCCPVPQAVCCSDQDYCCPQGYTCTTGNMCTQSSGLDWRLLLGNRKRAATL